MGKGNRNRDKRKTEKNYPIKEIIYTDEIQLNSLLAQLDEGLMTALELTNQALSGKGKTATTSGDLGINGGIGILNGNSSLSGTKSSSETEHNMSQQVVKTIYNDYAINVLEERLGTKLKRLSVALEGNLVKYTAPFKLFNPQAMENMMDNFKGIMPYLDLSNELEELEEFDSGIELLSFATKLTSGDCIFSFGDGKAIAIAPIDNFRRTIGQLQAIQASKSKLTILGLVETIVNDDLLSFDNNSSTNNYSGTDSDSVDTKFLAEFINTFAPKINFLILFLLGFIKPGAKIIHPIAIYFE
ncbi:hypothetical protein SY212_18060 [Ligilactobacillus agilis]|uniref:Uncharacterized protein n=1 Tax=Ligilactobacillus agilis TaxID=1601 RepID=A0A6F9XNE7_9LACO|nr:hypothetical protein [Ligilactobacillus agilis]GET06776.1 hypothetical protein SY212_18060 [Ligilactobacillus agilis]